MRPLSGEYPLEHIFWMEWFRRYPFRHLLVTNPRQQNGNSRSILWNYYCRLASHVKKLYYDHE